MTTDDAFEPVDWSGLDPNEPIPVEITEGVEIPEEWNREESNLYTHAREELRSAGLLSEESDYDGMLGEAVLEIVEVFARQGHSGFSAEMTVELLNRLLRFEPLGPLTDNPGEWMRVNPDDEPDGLWQNRRKADAFSPDGGKTYYQLSDPMDSHGNLPIHITEKSAHA